MDDELGRDYAGAGFGGRLGFGTRPAVCVVDVCMAYVEPSSPLYAGAEHAYASTGRVVDAARATGTPVVWTRVEYQPGGVDGGVFFRKVAALRHFVAGSPLAEFPSDVAPAPGEAVFTKQYASGFFGTSLAATLTAAGVDTLVICGVSTSGCVRATAVDACQHGFVPIVVREAVADRDERPHEANLFDIDAKYGDVMSEPDVIEHLKGNR